MDLAFFWLPWLSLPLAFRLIRIVMTQKGRDLIPGAQGDRRAPPPLRAALCGQSTMVSATRQALNRGSHGSRMVAETGLSLPRDAGAVVLGVGVGPFESWITPSIAWLHAFGRPASRKATTSRSWPKTAQSISSPCAPHAPRCGRRAAQHPPASPELAWQIADADVTTILVDQAHADLARAASAAPVDKAPRRSAGAGKVTPPQAHSLESPQGNESAEGGEGGGCRRPAFPAENALHLDEVHGMIYTSGTTGFPKGPCSLTAITGGMPSAPACNLGGHGGDVWLAVVPLFHVGAASRS